VFVGAKSDNEGNQPQLFVLDTQQQQWSRIDNPCFEHDKYPLQYHFASLTDW
jgi:hypothetical protein